MNHFQCKRNKMCWRRNELEKKIDVEKGFMQMNFSFTFLASFPHSFARNCRKHYVVSKNFLLVNQKSSRNEANKSEQKTRRFDFDFLFYLFFRSDADVVAVVEDKRQNTENIIQRKLCEFKCFICVCRIRQCLAVSVIGRVEWRIESRIYCIVHYSRFMANRFLSIRRKSDKFVFFRIQKEDWIFCFCTIE